MKASFVIVTRDLSLSSLAAFGSSFAFGVCSSGLAVS